MCNAGETLVCSLARILHALLSRDVELGEAGSIEISEHTAELPLRLHALRRRAAAVQKTLTGAAADLARTSALLASHGFQGPVPAGQDTAEDEEVQSQPGSVAAESP